MRLADRIKLTTYLQKLIEKYCDSDLISLNKERINEGACDHVFALKESVVRRRSSCVFARQCIDMEHDRVYKCLNIRRDLISPRNR